MDTHGNLIRRFSDRLGCEMVNEMAKCYEQVLAQQAFSTDPGCRGNRFITASPALSCDQFYCGIYSLVSVYRYNHV